MLSIGTDVAKLQEMINEIREDFYVSRRNADERPFMRALNNALRMDGGKKN